MVIQPVGWGECNEAQHLRRAIFLLGFVSLYPAYKTYVFDLPQKI